KGMSSPAAMQIRMLARHNAVPIGLSAALRSRLRVSRLIEHGRISAGWAKEIGTLTPTGTSITKARRQRSRMGLVTLLMRPADIAFTATRSNTGWWGTFLRAENRERLPATGVTI